LGAVATAEHRRPIRGNVHWRDAQLVIVDIPSVNRPRSCTVSGWKPRPPVTEAEVVWPWIPATEQIARCNDSNPSWPD
jgi:hypothetical protein